MIEFHGWRQPYDMDVMACVGTWASLVKYKSTGTVKLWQWRVTAAVSGRDFRKELKSSTESALNLLRAKIHQAVDEGARLIQRTTESKWLVTTDRRGHKRARKIDGVWWMHNRELNHLPVNQFTGRPNG